MSSALEHGFPFETVDQVAEVESYRKEVNRPIYHVHKWWANRLGSVFRAMLIGAAEPGDADIWARFYEEKRYHDFVVLDPFMGSGTTVGEAIKLGMKAVGCDINPVSTFAVRQALRQVDADALQAAYDSLERRVADRIRGMYVTTDRDSGAVIPALYYFWVKELELPSGERVPLFNSYVFSSNAYPGKKPIAKILCPDCGAIISDRFDSTSTVCPHCTHRFNPQVGTCDGTTVRDADGNRHKIRDIVQRKASAPTHRMFAILALAENGEKVYLQPTEADLALYAQCSDELQRSNLLRPTMTVRPGHNTNQARGYNYLEWRHFFNDRQLLALATLLDGIVAIKDRSVREQLICLFSGTLEFNNLFCSFKGEGTGAVRHMFSHHILKPERMPLENSVWGTERSSGTFSTLFKSRLMRAQEYLRRPFEIAACSDGAKVKSQKVFASAAMKPILVEEFDALSRADGAAALLLNGDSTNLPLPSASVDAVLTDPPYFDFVHYSELSDFFFAWLSPVLRSEIPYFDRQDSSHEGEVQDKDPENFARKIGRVFAECHRVLKSDGVLAFTFHHSMPVGWLAIHEALALSGFVVAAAHPIKAEMSVGNPKSAAKEPINLDAILVCRKRREHVPRSRNVAAAVAVDSAKLRERFREIGRHLSRGDKFVIEASQVLHHGSVAGLDKEHVDVLLGAAHARCHGDAPADEVALLKPRLHRNVVEPSASKPHHGQLDLFGTQADSKRARRRHA